MNEIKFRCWDNEKNYFLFPFPITWNDNEPPCSILEEKQSFLVCANGDLVFCGREGDFRYNGCKEVQEQLKQRYVLQQYTGCKDKNGKEIYEGDIIKHTSIGTTRNGQIRFYAGAFFAEWENQHDDRIGYLLTNEIEVIGNIYEKSKV